MKPLCIVPVYNEADILPWTLRHIIGQGCEPYVLDNMSTDVNWAVLAGMLRDFGVHAGIEQIDTGGKYDWTAILKRIEEIALERGRGRWCMLYDADEIRSAPWVFATLQEALCNVQKHGYNAVDFRVRCYAPIDNGWVGQCSPEEYFRHYLPEHVDQGMHHIKAWLQGDERVDLHTHGGHQALFANRRVYPVPFMLKHYPIRGQQHGERKVLRERLARYTPEERAKHWHVQYDLYRAGAVPIFLHDPKDLIEDK